MCSEIVLDYFALGIGMWKETFFFYCDAVMCPSHLCRVRVESESQAPGVRVESESSKIFVCQSDVLSFCKNDSDLSAESRIVIRIESCPSK